MVRTARYIRRGPVRVHFHRTNCADQGGGQWQSLPWPQGPSSGKPRPGGGTGRVRPVVRVQRRVRPRSTRGCAPTVPSAERGRGWRRAPTTTTADAPRPQAWSLDILKEPRQPPACRPRPLRWNSSRCDESRRVQRRVRPKPARRCAPTRRTTYRCQVIRGSSRMVSWMPMRAEILCMNPPMDSKRPGIDLVVRFLLRSVPTRGWRLDLHARGSIDPGGNRAVGFALVPDADRAQRRRVSALAHFRLPVAARRGRAGSRA